MEETRTAGALRVHVAERSDVLVDALASVLAQAPPDPFTPDVVLVPTRGVERWVAQRLSHRLGAGPPGDGICANVRFSSPARAVSDVLARVLGVSPDDDPWAPERVAWHVLGVLDDARDDPRLGTPVGHLGDPRDDVRQGRRLRLAQRLAGLLASYD
ncbi:exodeoxyribonuclease V subunit gamma, partial [Cellulomonas septica]|uniref:exodeoxyribonuclease V subunit gamma n=1 Tax=Cellulomonas septica TaxID=285080 RepID=UPI0031B59A2B